MITIESILKEHSFFKDLPSKYFDFIVGCASNVVFKKGEVILKEGQSEDKFYVIRGGGDILGWSWLIPPYRYRFSAEAVENTRAVVLDGKCLRGKCEKNSDLGYELLKRLMSVFTQRLEATRLQLLDVYSINVENK